MATLTFPEINAHAASYHALHNSVTAQARRHAFALRSLLVDLDHAQRAEILTLLLDELSQIDQPLPLGELGAAVESLAP